MKVAAQGGSTYFSHHHSFNKHIPTAEHVLNVGTSWFILTIMTKQIP